MVSYFALDFTFLTNFTMSFITMWIWVIQHPQVTDVR